MAGTGWELPADQVSPAANKCAQHQLEGPALQAAYPLSLQSLLSGLKSNK